MPSSTALSSAPKAATTRSAAAATTASHLVLLVATRKGAWLFHGDRKRTTWTADGPHFLGHTISHLQLDPRDGRTLLAAANWSVAGAGADLLRCGMTQGRSSAGIQTRKSDINRSRSMGLGR